MKQGPLSILHNCMSKGLKLKVWTKRHAGFRGICIGYLLAFDKHFNMVRPFSYLPSILSPLSATDYSQDPLVVAILRVLNLRNRALF